MKIWLLILKHDKTNNQCVGFKFVIESAVCGGEFLVDLSLSLVVWDGFNTMMMFQSDSWQFLLCCLCPGSKAPDHVCDWQLWPDDVVTFTTKKLRSKLVTMLVGQMIVLRPSICPHWCGLPSGGREVVVALWGVGMMLVAFNYPNFPAEDEQILTNSQV